MLSSGVVELDWNNVRSADSYEAQFFHNDQWIDLPATSTEIAFDGAGAVVRGLPDSDAHYFRVRAVNSHGVSVWSAQLFLPMQVVLEGELAAGQQTDILPVSSGYSVFGSLGGTLTPDAFVIDGTTHEVQYLTHSSGGLWLGMDRELPSDFTLRVGDSTYLAARAWSLPP